MREDIIIKIKNVSMVEVCPLLSAFSVVCDVTLIFFTGNLECEFLYQLILFVENKKYE